MLVAGAKIRDWIQHRHDNQLSSFRDGIFSERRVHSYLMHLGFFDFIFMDEGKCVGEAGGSSAYLPITRLERPSFNPCDNTVSDWYEAIQYQAKRLARVLSNGHEGALETYTYSIREILRNVFEHSQSRDCYICGQRWWGGKVEIAIIDEGVGIAETLKESYDIKSDQQALELSIEPGTSRINFQSSANYFDNSGFGLYILSEIGSRFGWFALGSGCSRVIRTAGINTFEQFRFPGTFIGIQLFSPITDFGSVLPEIIEDGENRSDQSGVAQKASGASKIIRF